MRESWEKATLKSVCAIEKEKFCGKDLPYVGLEHIESGTGRHVGSLDPITVKSSTFRFTAAHVLYGRLRPYLNKVLLPEFVGHCSSEIFPLRVKPSLDRRFLYYWLTWQPIVEEIDKTSTGARMPRANVNKMLDFEVPLPPLPEQTRIVAILDDAFAGIEAAIANTEKNLANVRELFVSSRDSTFEAQTENWHSIELDDLCTIKHGFAFKSVFFTTEGDYIVLTPGSFYEHGGFRDQGKKTKYYEGEIPEDYLLEKGDFLFAMTEQAAGLLGSSLVIPESNCYLHNQRLGLVQSKNGVEWHNDFFFHQFNTTKFRSAVQLTASGAKVRHTSPKKLCAISVVYPPSRNEQVRVAHKLNGLWEETQSLESIYQQKLTALAELKQSLLQKAFSGEPTADKAAPDTALKDEACV